MVPLRLTAGVVEEREAMVVVLDGDLEEAVDE
ncbi:hypothetical protein A2U01_0076013, partial [Trifolium medium]|nr:hypothetical protein [Trifolium medium]